MAASRFFWQTAGGAISLAQQRHAAGHATALPAAEHGDLHTNFAVAGGNGSGVAMVAVHSQAATVAEGLVIVQGLLQGGLEFGRGFGVPVGFPGGPSVP